MYRVLEEKVHNDYLQRAKRKNLEFSLTLADFYYLMKLPCIYCNKINDIKDGKTKVFFMGIDRIDNNKGYFWENCVPACKECNTSKSSCSIELMRKILEWKKYGG
jgi:hypothetical protein